MPEPVLIVAGCAAVPNLTSEKVALKVEALVELDSGEHWHVHLGDEHGRAVEQQVRAPKTHGDELEEATSLWLLFTVVVLAGNELLARQAEEVGIASREGALRLLQLRAPQRALAPTLAILAPLHPDARLEVRLVVLDDAGPVPDHDCREERERG